MTTTRSTIATTLANESRRFEVPETKAGEVEARKPEGLNLSPEIGPGTESVRMTFSCISGWADESLAENLDKGILSRVAICI
jgi:hypothetical protein